VSPSRPGVLAPYGTLHSGLLEASVVSLLALDFALTQLVPTNASTSNQTLPVASVPLSHDVPVNPVAVEE